MLQVAGIREESIVDGPGVRYTIFAQGCNHNCDECHNPETHALDGGRTMKIDKLIEEISGKELITGVTFTGGEPFLQALSLAELGRKIKVLEKDLDILVYTGFNYEDLLINKEKIELLEVSDILIDGLFQKADKDLSLSYRGSSNQRIIDVKRSLQQDEAVTTTI